MRDCMHLIILLLYLTFRRTFRPSSKIWLFSFICYLLGKIGKVPYILLRFENKQFQHFSQYLLSHSMTAKRGMIACLTQALKKCRKMFLQSP